MIIKHNVVGTKGTSFHDFDLTTNGRDLVISSGSYYRADEEIFSSDTGATIRIPTPTEITHYQIWLTDLGLQVLERTDSQEFAHVENPIDRLAWFSVDVNFVNLEEVEIHFVKVVAPDVSKG